MAILAVTSAPTIAPSIRPSRTAFGLSLALAAAATTAGVLTYTFGGLLRGPEAMNGSARGTALVMAAVVAPALLLAMWLTRRGSARALVVWFGMVLHLAYNSVLLTLGEPMNRLFLLYEASLALAIAAAISLFVTTHRYALACRVSPALPVRAFAAYLLVAAGLNALAWLGRIVPATARGTVPDLLEGTGLSTVPTYFEDLAFWLPAIAVAAWWLWQRRPDGFLLAGGAIAFWAVESLTVAVDQWVGHRADPVSPVASGGAALAFALLFLVGAVVLARFLRHIRPIRP